MSIPFFLVFSIERNFNLTISDLLLQVLGILVVNGAPNGHARAEDLLNGPTQVLGHGPGPHDLGDLDDVIKGDVAVVPNVLGLLAVALGLLEGLDDEGGGRGDHRDLSLTVLDGELDGDAEALPVLGGFLGNIFTDLLGRQTQRTDLGSERGSCTHLAAGDSDVDVHHLTRVELRRHVGSGSTEKREKEEREEPEGGG
uniref:60S ribosomal protein L12-like n=1 Tax=Rhizophora mucronata TaxID=61149 RepID=A0A2P2KFV1_RHIMU